MRVTKARPYQMRRRAEQVDETRQRITEATVRLHTTVGPARTSIAAVAEAAGVTRLTVYRHFADLGALFTACRAHWVAQNPRPDPNEWLAIGDPVARARVALGELYQWYQDHAADLYPIYRDAGSMPMSAQIEAAVANRQLADALIDGQLAALPELDRPILEAVAGHLVDFLTWRSLVVHQGLEIPAAVETAVRMLTGAAGGQNIGPI